MEERKLVAEDTEEFEPESFVFLPNNSIMAMYRDKIEIRKHSLELMNTIQVDRINYFSANNNSACNICIQQDNGIVFSLQRRSLRTVENRNLGNREPLHPLSTNTASRVHHRRVRKIVSQPREAQQNVKMRNKELIFPAYLKIHSFDTSSRLSDSSIQCEMSISSEMESQLSVEDIKSEITCMQFDEDEKVLYLATKRGHVFKFQ